jgi:hypothetical protein
MSSLTARARTLAHMNLPGVIFSSSPNDRPTPCDRLAAAFPASVEDDVHAVLSALASTPHRTSSPLSGGSINGRERLSLRVQAEPIQIPSRIYLEAPRDDLLAGLSQVQRTILGCLYTRHHNGFARQRALRDILHSPHPWVVPFVVQLVGEYVIEIVTDIQRGLPELQDPASQRAEQYGRVLADNRAFLPLVSQRVASYWDCYYRPLHADPRFYPGRLLVSSLKDATSTWRG